MQIDEECWEGVVSWLGDGEGKKEFGGEGKRKEETARFVVQG